MSGKTDLLERAVELFPPPEGSFDCLVRRRDRRQRNRRITTIVFALALAFAAIGSAIEAFRDVHRRIPAGPAHVAWVRQFGTPGGDGAADVAVHGDLVYVSGSTSRGASGLPMGHEVAFLDSFDRAGDHAWHAGAGRGGYAVASDASGVYQGGYVHGQTFLAKFDPGGTELWSQPLGFGGYVESIAIYGGSVYVAGRAFDGVPGQAGIGHQDGFIGKYDATGRPMWVRLLGTPRWDEARGVAVDETGIYVTGVAGGTAYPPAEDVLWKLSEQGEAIWTRSAIHHAVEAIAASHGTIYVGGNHGGQAAIGAYDRRGARLWSEVFGTSTGDEIVDLVADARGVYAAGSMNERFGPRANERPGWHTVSSEGFVRAYDPLGSVRWELYLRADGPVFVRGIAGGGGSLYAVGWTEGTFEGQSTRGGVDAFVARMDLG